MGQEIEKSSFEPEDFEQFRQRLEAETRLLESVYRSGGLSGAGPLGGFELEAWLVDEAMQPAPVNAAFLQGLSSPLASPELARFNVEFNTSPLRVQGDFLSRVRQQLEATWRDAQAAASALGVEVIAIGILPTLSEAALNLRNLSDMKRYRALNEQVLAARGQRPIRLDIVGAQRLHCEHVDVMLEAAATSFQIHFQVPVSEMVQVYNVALLMSGPLVALGGNSPYLFGCDLWAETRIPLFEQAVAVGGYEDARGGPVKRVGFGSGYVKRSLTELFEENLAHHPVILPLCSDLPRQRFAHLRLHNGTIWRWNRPLLGFDTDGTPHLRLEHRVLPAGPSIPDMVANAAFFFGAVAAAASTNATMSLPFAMVRDNFYQAAQHGLKAHVSWLDGERHGLRGLLLHRLIPEAGGGLERLGVDRADIAACLGILERRVESGRTGSEWQRRFLAKRPGCFADMTRVYLEQQREARPVSEWVM